MSTIPTSEGDMTIAQITSSVYYTSYATNRDEGLSHELLVNIGIGNEAMRIKYESETLPDIFNHLHYNNGLKQNL